LAEISTEKNILQTRNLEHIFPNGHKVLKGINLRLKEGQLYVLGGENGCGKTVLMKHLNGLLKATAGKVEYKGADISRNLKAVRQKIGLVFQNSDNQLFRPTLKQDIAFGPENLGWNKEKISEAVNNALHDMGLIEYADERPHILSGGWKKRAAIAGILAMDPEIICFDEPFTGLDLQGVRQVTESILHLKKSGKTLLIITHDLEKILAHADQLILMKEGQISRQDTPENLMSGLEDFNIRIPWGTSRNIETMTWLN